MSTITTTITTEHYVAEVTTERASAPVSDTGCSGVSVRFWDSPDREDGAAFDLHWHFYYAVDTSKLIDGIHDLLWEMENNVWNCQRMDKDGMVQAFSLWVQSYFHGMYPRSQSV